MHRELHLEDQLNRTVSLSQPASRIVSCVPSITEYLYSLGLGDKVVGITKFCVRPDDWFKNKSRIGGTKKLHTDSIRELKPDLIIANKEENNKDEIQSLSSKIPTYISNIKSLEDAYVMMEDIGTLTAEETSAIRIIKDIKTARSEFHNSVSGRKYKVAYFIWKNPYMVSGGDTFINTLLNEAGFENIFGHLKRYPSVNMEDILESNLDYLFFSSEPFPFTEERISEWKEHFEEKQLQIVDGEMFSWYGSRLKHAFPYFYSLRNRIES